MNADVASVLDAALGLPAESRAIVADRLLQSLDQPDQAEVAVAWAEEAERRLAGYQAGKIAADLPGTSGEWNDAKNARRCDLIDKDTQGTLGPEERRELESLTRELRAYRRTIAPISLDGATRLHQQLLEKKRQQEAQGDAP